MRGGCAGMVWRRIIFIQLLVISWASVVRGFQQTFDRQSLDSLIGEHALKKNPNMRTGRLYDVPLPANFSGMEAYVVRLRSGSLWKRGANFSLFHIPPNILPVPFVRRMDLVFENLGNWSSSYYKLLNNNHTLVAPVVGLLAYDAGSSNTSRRIEFRTTNDYPILVRFPNITNKNNASMKCVRFGINGAVVEEFSNVTMDGLCVARGQGHFSLVIPTPTPTEKKTKKKAWKWWAVGIGIVGGLIFVGIILIWMYKVVKKKRVEKMQRESEQSEVLDTVWVGGRSRLPYASAIRTQPVLEDTYVP